MSTFLQFSYPDHPELHAFYCNGDNGSALRNPRGVSWKTALNLLPARRYFPIRLSTRLSREPFLATWKQDVMIDRIEELRQVNINGDAVALCRIYLRAFAA